MKLKEVYESSTALFTGITTPASDFTDEIKNLVYNRWRNNDLINVDTTDDITEWREWFEFITLTAWDVADKLLTSAALITDPLKTFSRTSQTSGTNTGQTSTTNTGSGSTTDSSSSSGSVTLDKDTTSSTSGSLTDTLKVETDGESADATSGYNNTNAEGSTGQTVKESDTPQSAVANLTAGYLSKVTQTEGTAESETASNYLDASSHNKSETVQHSGGQSTTETGSGTEDSTTTDSRTTSGTSTSTDTRTIAGTESFADSHTTTESGYMVSQAELVKQYRETITNVRREVADLWHECFDLWYGFAI